MVWKYFVQTLRKADTKLALNQAILIHSGGWKKLQDEAVSNDIFRHQLTAVAGIEKIHGFYGMVEQTGTIYVECERGHLHTPAAADILVRDPRDWSTKAFGEEGVIQLFSTLASSYPGHSILTEDRGTVLGEDTCLCGRMGKFFKIYGRVPMAELRGCSDTATQAA
jgi:hypothetical protein